MDSNELKERVKEFAHRCVKLATALPDTPLGRQIKVQLIRCSSSAAANYRAACIAQSKASFIAKMSIVAEETDESCSWLQFIVDEKLMTVKQIESLLEEGEELTRIFLSSRMTARKRNH
ncbi:MAG: four helix bundle protein [Phycisphaerae bacterium]|jgi:four helix bundle protein